MIRDFNKFLLLEKYITIDKNLEKKLKFINTDLSKDILNFLRSNNIKDDANVESINIENDDNKTLTVLSDFATKRKYKIGKLLNLIGYDIDKVNKRELEDFVMFFKKSDHSNFKLVNSEEDIKYAYYNINYELGNEDLNTSCMGYEHCQDYFDIYIKNPKVCSLLVLYNDINEIRGRSLILTLDNGNKYMDRIYVSNKQYMNEFYKLAEDNGIDYVYKTDKNMCVKLDVSDFEYYPYMDTFLYKSDNELYNNLPDYETNIISLNDANGGYNEPVYCPILEKYFKYDDMVYVTDGSYAEENLHNSVVVDLYKGGTALIDDCVMIEVGSYEDEYFLSSDNIHIEIECGKDKGKLAHIEDCVKITYGKFKDCYVLKENTIETKNGIEYEEY